MQSELPDTPERSTWSEPEQEDGILAGVGESESHGHRHLRTITKRRAYVPTPSRVLCASQNDEHHQNGECPVTAAHAAALAVNCREAQAFESYPSRRSNRIEKVRRSPGRRSGLREGDGGRQAATASARAASKRAARPRNGPSDHEACAKHKSFVYKRIREKSTPPKASPPHRGWKSG